MFIRNIILVTALSLAPAWGCTRHHNNPYADSSRWVQEAMTTPSAEVYGEREAPAHDYRRVWQDFEVNYQNCAVTHWPIRFENSYENRGNNTAEECAAAGGDPFAINNRDVLIAMLTPFNLGEGLVFFPINAVVYPPWLLVESDGRYVERRGMTRDVVRADKTKRDPVDRAPVDSSAAE